MPKWEKHNNNSSTSGTVHIGSLIQEQSKRATDSTRRIRSIAGFVARIKDNETKSNNGYPYKHDLKRYQPAITHVLLYGEDVGIDWSCSLSQVIINNGYWCLDDDGWQ